MTAATNKALELYPAPEQWEPSRGINTDRMTDEEKRATARALMLRGSLMSDEWPRMVRAFSMVMGLPIPSEPVALDPETRAEHVRRLARAVNDLDQSSDLIKQIGETFDIAYLAVRVLVGLGLSDTQILAGFTEAHAANMTKVQDSGRPLVNDGIMAPDEPIGKVLKTNNYVAPDYATAMSLGKQE